MFLEIACHLPIARSRAKKTADSKGAVATERKRRVEIERKGKIKKKGKRGGKRSRAYKPQEEARMVVGPVWGLLTTLTLLRANTALYHPRGRERIARAPE